MNILPMPIRKLVAVACLSIAATAGAATANDGGLIRIEPRLFYGATVTMENGVRVWRALPATRQMIINPTNAPVNVNIADVREQITNHNHNYVHGVPAASGDHAGAHYSAPAYYYGRRFAGRHHAPRADRGPGTRSGARFSARFSGRHAGRSR